MWKYLKMLSLGADAVMIAAAIDEEDAHAAVMGFMTLLVDIGAAAKIKELTPDVVNDFRVDVDNLVTKILAHAK